MPSTAVCPRASRARYPRRTSRTFSIPCVGPSDRHHRRAGARRTGTVLSAASTIRQRGASRSFLSGTNGSSRRRIEPLLDDLGMRGTQHGRAALLPLTRAFAPRVAAGCARAFSKTYFHGVSWACGLLTEQYVNGKPLRGLRRGRRRFGGGLPSPTQRATS